MAYSGSASERLAFVRARMAETMTAIRIKTGRDKEVERESLRGYESLERRLMDEVAAEQSGGSMAESIVITGGC